MPLVFIFLWFFSTTAVAEIIIESVSGASQYTVPIPGDESANTLVIYAGIAGQCLSGESIDGGITCNSCEGGLAACNERRIDEGGSLSISFSSTSTSGWPILTNADGVIADAESHAINNLQVGQGTLTTLSVPWIQICGGLCQESRDYNMNIGISTGNDGTLEAGDDSLRVSLRVRGGSIPPTANEGFGVFRFALFKGDEKVFLLVEGDEQYDLLNDRPDLGPLEFGPNSFPVIDGNTFVALRFYYEEGQCGAFIGNRSFYVRTGIEDIGNDKLRVNRRSFTASENEGFQNGTTYNFKIALEDEAGNVGFFTPDCDPLWHVVTPEEVTGLLDPGFNGCFIATAAYGPYHKLLHTFYQFRDKKLLPYTLGRKIHNLYYTYSPPLAQKIQNNTFLKYIARIMLIPLWMYAFLTLQVGHIFTLLFLMCAITFMIYFFKRKPYQLLKLRKFNQ